MSRSRRGYPLGLWLALAGAAAGLVALVWLALSGAWELWAALTEAVR